MGKVFLVRHADTGQLGALKTLRGDPDPDEEERFHREVEVLATLKHPAIVRLLDSGEHDGAPWLVMDYATGENLEARLSRGQAIPVAQALPMFAALADGLRHAHEQGIHHRDVKAENVVVRDDGWACLVDFGVALKKGAARLTNAGFVMGTFAYLPPEVIQGGERDPAASDLYSLGQLLYESLTGTQAFRGDPGEKNSRKKWSALITAKTEAGPLDPGPAFPDELRRLVREATEPEPEDRLASVGELADRLRRLLDTRQDALLDGRLGASWGGAPPRLAGPPTPREAPPRGAWLALGALGLGGLASLALAALFLGIAIVAAALGG